MSDLTRRALHLFIPLAAVVAVYLFFWQGSILSRRANTVPLGGWSVEEKARVTEYELRLTGLPDADFPTIMMKNTTGAVEVYLDGRRIFENRMDMLVRGNTVNGTLHFISLPEDYNGKTLKIMLYAPGASFSDHLKEPLFGDYRLLFQIYILERFPMLATGTFLLIFGVAFAFLTVSFTIRTEAVARHLISAIISVDLGIWLLCDNDLMILYLPATYSSTTAYLSFYLMLPLLALMLSYIYEGNRLLRNAAIVGFGACIGIFAMHATGMLNMAVFRLPASIIFLVIAVYFMLAYLRRSREYIAPDIAMQERGIFIFDLFMLVYLETHTLEELFRLELGSIHLQLPAAGCFIYGVTQMLNYYLNISESYARRRDYASLNQLAYVDVLTGLPNRKSANNVFRALNSALGNYCIVSLDVNGLKQVNDSLGHREGDVLLQQTARILNNCFDDKGFRARLGGDEFLIVINRIEEKALELLEEEANRRLMRDSEKEFGVACSIAIGHAFREECPDGESEDVFRLADARMYADKAAHHAADEEQKKPAA